MFKPKFPANEVDNLIKFYWPTQSERMQRAEHDLESRAPYIHSRQFLTKDEFRLVCSWTAIRARQRYEKNTEAAIREITGRAFHAENERQRIDTLKELDGVAYPVASTILHFFHPDTYPILTYPSLWSLSIDEIPFDNFDFWMDYTTFFRQLVIQWKISPRNLDRALWQYHYDAHASEVNFDPQDF